MDPFILKLILSFFVGGTAIVVSTIVAEKYGSKIGGAVGGFPYYAGASLFFIGLTQSAQVASKSAEAVPLLMAVNSLFVAIYILMRKQKLWLSLGAAFLFWFVAAVLILHFQIQYFIFNIIAFIACLLIAYYLVEKLAGVSSVGRIEMKYTFSIILFRALLAGLVISGTVILAKLGGPLVGGVLATFPVGFSSTILIAHVTHGYDFASALIKSTLVSGGITTTVYAILVKYFYISSGLAFGTIFAFILVIIFGYISYSLINKKMV